DRDSRYVDPLSRCGHAKPVASMSRGASPAYADPVVLSEGVVDLYRKIRERGGHSIVERIELFGSFRFVPAVVYDGIRPDHFGYCLAPSFVPDLFEPAGSQVSLQLGHPDPPPVVYATSNPHGG